MLESTERRHAVGGIWGEPVAHDVHISAQGGFSQSPPAFDPRAMADVLATLRQQWKATFALP